MELQIFQNAEFGSVRSTMLKEEPYFVGKDVAEILGYADPNKATLGKMGEAGLRILKGKRKRKKLDMHRGIPDPNGKDVVVQKKAGGETSCPLKNVRIIKKGTGIYSLNFEIPHDVEYGRIELVTVGENGKSNRLRITDVNPTSACETAKLNGDFIETLNMTSSEKVKIIVTLADSHDYAMEVNVYEHN